MQLADAIERWVDLRREDFDDDELHELADIWRRVKRNEASEIDVGQMDKADARTIMRLFEDDERPRVASLLNDVRDWALEQPPIRTVSIGVPDPVPAPTAPAAGGALSTQPAPIDSPPHESGLLIPPATPSGVDVGVVAPDLASPNLVAPDPVAPDPVAPDPVAPDLVSLGESDLDVPELTFGGLDGPGSVGGDFDVDVPQSSSEEVPGLGRPAIDTPLVAGPSSGAHLLNAPPPSGQAIAYDRPPGVATGPVRPLTGTNGPLPPLAGESDRQIPMAAVAGVAGLVLLLLVGWLLFGRGDDSTDDATATQADAAVATTQTSDEAATIAQPVSDSEAFCALMRRYEVADPVGELTIVDGQAFVETWSTVYADIGAVAPAAIAADVAGLSTYTDDLAQATEQAGGDLVAALLALATTGTFDPDLADERLAAFSLSECGVVFDVGTS